MGKHVTIPAMPTAWDTGAAGPANRDGLVEEARPHINPETGVATNPNGVRGVKRQSCIAAL